MELDQDLLTEAVVGAQAQAFLESDVGQGLLAKAELIAADAITELKRTLPTEASVIRELQNKIWLAESFERWIVELILDGKQATLQLQQQQMEKHEEMI